MSAAVRWLAEVIAAWLMPWRAVARARGQRQAVALLTDALAYAAAGSGPLLRGRAVVPPVRWWARPRPLALLSAALRPGRAVRDLAQMEDAVAWMIAAMMAQSRKHGGTAP